MYFVLVIRLSYFYGNFIYRITFFLIASRLHEPDSFFLSSKWVGLISQNRVYKKPCEGKIIISFVNQII